MRASVIIPAYNAGATLADCLRALRAQDFPRSDYETIVVDDGSSDNTVAIALSFGVGILGRTNGGAGAARNSGWRVARGEWIAFTDADCVPSRSWLRRLVEAAERSSSTSPALGAAGKTVGLDSATPAARFCDLAGSLDAKRHLAHPRFPFAPSSNLLYRRAALEAVDGFDERYSSYEACDLHCRLRARVGGAFVYEERAVVMHRHRPDWRSFWKQQYSYGQGYGQFVRLHHEECAWSSAQELREWGEIVSLGASLWRRRDPDDALYRKGMFVKRLAQRLGFLRTQLRGERRAL